ncbi:xanthine dehydrogenase family protein subunit M [Rhizobium sp. CFBP 8762]|uniref:FAD binding domain-containing protein n=1 Tax=Rhizobium sp. CFBP 8762 TaxID=2775279 RepID=UPI001786D5E7|nr:xanthine dehydrogenase family protein subunit M [Rhizobium sp. CFBP 8762]MBD8553133.1 xanthine dehydrogenase family protein subunit M [Rhizobium sp. CFBP 8762]
MNRFSYVKATSVDHAVDVLTADPAAKVLAGGTNLVDLMKYDVERPTTVVDIKRLPLGDIEALDDGALRIGALVSNADAAYDRQVEENCPLLASAILAGASPQLRNAATTGGNLMQRTRCYYFYDPSAPCNKRDPGTGCGAIGGVNRIHAILGASASCIATHPSDMCVGLAALDAVVEVSGPQGKRDIAFEDFHRLPKDDERGDRPDLDNTLQLGEIVTGVRVPRQAFGQNYTYLKLRDRLSYAFALVSVAAGLTLENGVITSASVALGGVAHKPWRDKRAEDMLKGQTPSREIFTAFAERILSPAVGQGDNDFKISLARRAIVRALAQAASGTPQRQSQKSYA